MKLGDFFSFTGDVSKNSYESQGGVAAHDFKKHLRKTERYFADRYLHGRVLDIGCGTGRTTALIAHTCEVVGIDYAKPMVTRARQHYPGLDFRVMDARTLEFPDASFDCVLFSFNGLDYLYPFTERLRVLREIRRVLAPGGVLGYSSHKGGWPAPNNPKRILGWLYARTHRIFAPYFASYTPYGVLITYSANPDTQAATLADEGFALLEHMPEKESEEFYIARRV